MTPMDAPYAMGNVFCRGRIHGRYAHGAMVDYHGTNHGVSTMGYTIDHVHAMELVHRPWQPIAWLVPWSIPWANISPWLVSTMGHALVHGRGHWAVEVTHAEHLQKRPKAITTPLCHWNSQHSETVIAIVSCSYTPSTFPRRPVVHSHVIHTLSRAFRHPNW